MKKKIYYVILTLIILGILLFAFGIVNTMVSLKYETNNPGDCISVLNGSDLCAAIEKMKAILIMLVFALIGLVIFKKKIV